MKLERGKNTKRNVLFGVINQTVVVLLPFIIRTILIKELGVEYVGLSGLFSSILSILSLSELGFDSAVVIIMYGAIANDDREKVNALLSFIRRVYYVVGSVIMVLGLLCLPILPHLISDLSHLPGDINIYYIYLVFLVSSSVSYFFGGYRHSLVVAFHRNDVISKVSICIHLIFFIAQVFILFEFKNYYYYVFTLPVLSLAKNLVVAAISHRLFPGIRTQGKVSHDDVRLIKKIVIGSFIAKVGARISISLDNLIISSFLGVVMLGYYSNYYYIANSVIMLLYIVYTSMQGGLGNSVNTESVEKNYRDMQRLNFIYNWVIGWFCYALFFLFQPFMYLWLGEKGMLPGFVPILLCILVYQSECFNLVGTYKTVLGIVWEDRFRPLAAGGFNLVLNILLVLWLKRYGEEYALIGIIVSTIISYALINCPWYVSLVFKKYFKKGFADFYLTTYKYFAVVIVCCILSIPLFRLIPIYVSGTIGWFYFLLRGILCVVIPNLLFWLIYRREDIFKESMLFLLNRIKS